MASSVISATNSLKSEVLLPFLSALGIVLFLFFIDEGYYDFRWMADAGNWVVFVMYLGVMFLIQWGIAHFLLGRIKGSLKALIMLGAIMPATIILFLWMVS